MLRMLLIRTMLKIILFIMSVEQPSFTSSFEQQLTAYATLAVKMTKLAILRGAMRLAGIGEASGASPAISPLSLAPHETLSAEKRTSRVDLLGRCAVAFTTATQYQLETDKTIIKSSTVYGLTSEYIAITGPRKPKLFLHRPALDSEAVAYNPYWLCEEAVSNDVTSGLPVLHYREFVIDKLGNLLAREQVLDGTIVTRPLEAYEAQPYIETLDSLTIRPIAPAHQKTNTA